MENKNIKLPEPKYKKAVESNDKKEEKKKKKKEKYLDLLFDDSFISSYFLTVNLKNS